MALELPLSTAQTELASAITQLRAAHTDLIAGRYDSTVSRCRAALDTMNTVLKTDSPSPDVAQVFSSGRASREAMTKHARAQLVRIAVRHYTHLAHHVDPNGLPEFFSRHDALFILAATAGSVWDAAGELIQRVQPTEAS